MSLNFFFCFTAEKYILVYIFFCHIFLKTKKHIIQIQSFTLVWFALLQCNTLYILNYSRQTIQYKRNDKCKIIYCINEYILLTRIRINDVLILQLQQPDSILEISYIVSTITLFYEINHFTANDKQTQMVTFQFLPLSTVRRQKRYYIRQRKYMIPKLLFVWGGFTCQQKGIFVTSPAGTLL